MAQIGMYVSFLLLTTLFTTITIASPLQSGRKHPSCGETIKMISARGTGTPPGPGGFQVVANNIIATLNSSNPVIKAVDYPATLTNPAYMDSVTLGAHNAQAQVMSAVDRCPDVNIVLFGYSQGANVVLDAAFGSVNGLNLTQPLAAKYQNQIRAIVVMGDPTHYQPQTFVVGTANSSGNIPRITNYECSPLTGRIMSFCDMGDPYCADGNNVTVHTTYLERYRTQAVSFTMAQLAPYL